MKINAVLYGIALSMVMGACIYPATKLIIGQRTGNVNRPAATPVKPIILNSKVQPVAHPVPVYLKSTPVKVQGEPQVLPDDQRYSPVMVEMYIDPQLCQNPVTHLVMPEMTEDRNCPVYLWPAARFTNPPFNALQARVSG